MFPGGTNLPGAAAINFPPPVMRKLGERGRGVLLAAPPRLITRAVAVTLGRARSGK